MIGKGSVRDREGPGAGPAGGSGTVSTVTWKPGEGGPEEFYLGLGYRKRGLTDDGEYLGDLDLTAA